jgi:subtilisin family serine protease
MKVSRLILLSALVVGVLNGASQTHWAQPNRVPDLTITSISFTPENPKPGEKLTIKVTVANLGRGDAGSFELCFSVGLASAEVAQVYGAPIHEIQVQKMRFRELRAESSQQVEIHWEVLEVPLIRLIFEADCAIRSVTESNEDNNRAERRFFIDERFLDQWWLDQIEARRAHEITRGAPEVLVAVIDSGIDRTHPEIKDRTIRGYDFADDDPDSLSGSRINLHGTSVAGLIGSAADGVGLTGLAPQVRLLDVRVCDTEGRCRFTAIAAGIRFAVERGARVINLSLGGFFDDANVRTAIQEAIAKGVIVVAAAGNGGARAVAFPAAYPGVIAVAATDRQGALASYSNRGAQTLIAAPGGDFSEEQLLQFFQAFAQDFQQLVPKLKPNLLTIYPSGTYGWFAGTSGATPLVSGTMALMLSVNPKLTNDQVRKILRETAKPIRGASGFGLVDVARAVQAAKSAAGN